MHFYDDILIIDKFKKRSQNETTLWMETLFKCITPVI